MKNYITLTTMLIGIFCHAALAHDQVEEASRLLSCNMAHYTSAQGRAVELYSQSILDTKMPCSTTVLTDLWRAAIHRAQDSAIYEGDDQWLSASFIRDHVSQSYRAWQEAPWHKAVSYDDYCHYILPYRISDERIDAAGDSILHTIYAPLIAGMSDVRDAFAAVCDTVYEQMREVHPQCPYTLDAYTIHTSRQATCEQRGILLVHILRSLGIPCSIDIFPFWANYSQVGHSWVVLIFKGKTYSYQNGRVQEVDSCPIDAASFQCRYKPTESDHYPYPVYTEKKVTKIYRMEFVQPETTVDSLSPMADSGMDVSKEYGLRHTIQIEMPNVLNDQKIYLCTFRTGSNWTPIATAIVKEDRLIFENVVAGNVYLCQIRKEDRLVAYQNPFLLNEDNSLSYFNPNSEERKITLKRKYPIFSYWINQWGNMKGGTIEGDSDETFAHPDTLCILSQMPFPRLDLKVAGQKAYRYVRYHASPKSRTPVAELIFGRGEMTLQGRAVAWGVDSAHRDNPFDGNPKSVSSTKKPGYWIGLDLGTPQAITDVAILAKNDGNDIVPGHRYELFYYNNRWVSLGTKIALSDELKYYVPSGAIFLLKDRTAGHEERIFIYDQEKNIQVWY